MRIPLPVSLLISIALCTCMGYAQETKHLFILSGQSNMVGSRPEESFLPLLEHEFGKQNVIVVKDAMGSQPIRRWYKNWNILKDDTTNTQPDLYDLQMKKVTVAIKGQNIRTVTFIWMQGERDAREAHG
ncbi:MAG TPA: sialate O-acetylesterase, partial [Phnomibacter sp.]|nr:sialate O-acetylesterase [Phnomibacter sp.]